MVLSSYSTPKCQETQTPEPRPFLGPGQSGESTEYEPYAASILFYLLVSHSFIPRGYAKSHGLLDEVMLLHIFTHPFSKMVMLGMLCVRIDVAI
jgi:hypothetical protein